ncbi:DUF1003 domain-containing protein [Methylocystis sp. H62]|uniref:DUF1003 domain-containing protein n=1 Tax=Methylocystis sp. H62 TaxID=2785789 RepID=UPI0018C30873|nr:DUF1003 domain-containing protein [Methylocystis sp. H62]MBG0793066.1 DUF1003 domain-containing protein [Methylocystis sp. H62]
MKGSPNSVPKFVHENIDAVIEAEQEAEEARSCGEVVYEFVAGVIGTLGFVITEIIAVFFWIAINEGLITPIPPFDPYPYHLLGAVLALEGVLIAAFVLMRQNRMSKLADRRAHLDLQINLMTERETTKIIGMLLEVSERLDIQHKVLDDESRQLSRLLTIESLIETMRGKFGD